MHPANGQHPLAGVGHAYRQQFPQPSTSTSQTQYYHSPESPVYPAPPESSKGTGQGGKKSRKSSQVVGEEDEGDEAEGRIRKKSKQSLSCGECKRRKIKCDRRIPCSSCIKRGASDACNWEDAKIEPEKQPFALVDDVDDLRDRLQLVERFLNTLPPALRTNMRELGIKSFGTKPKNDVKAEDGLDDCGEVMKKQLREGPGAGDSLGVLDSVLFGPDNAMTKGNTLLQVGPAELTSALTSIVAPRVIFVDASTSTNLGLDLCFSQSELDGERLRCLERIYRLLPSKEESDEIIKGYFTRLEWFFALLHHGSFYAELERFWEMVESGRRYEVDPAWLALLYLIFALSCDQTMHQDSDSPSTHASTWLDRAVAFHAAGQKLLHLSDCFGRPQIRVIQCTVLLACWTVVSSPGGAYGRFSSWLACAIRSAQKLGLHRLTADPEDMPPDDPAWPPGKNAVKREGALRLFSFLVFFDHIAASIKFKTYMIFPAHTTTPCLSNVNSFELSPTDWRVTSAPSSVMTDASLERHKYEMATISRRTFDALVVGGNDFNYGQILEIDRQYRELLASMPDVFQHEYSSLEEKDPIIRGKRYIARQGVHNRIVRLHRPFLVKGWQPNSKFAYSTESCIQSARIVLVSHHNNLDVNRNLRMMYSHSLTAAVVLAADLFHAIDIGACEAETESKRDVLAMALEVFSDKVQSRVASKHLRLVIESARRVLTGLFLEQEKRRAHRAALAVTGEIPTNEKPFAEILQGLAHNFDAAQAVPQPSQSSHAAVVLSPTPDAASTSFTNPSDPLGLGSFSMPVDSTLSTGNPNVDPLNALTSNLFQDLGLLPSGVNGQSFDYWSTNQPGMAQSNSNFGGSVDSGTNDSSPFDLAAFLGVGASGNHEQAAQAFMQQLTGGW